MGFLWNGRCYQDGASALQAFRASLTNGDSGGITTFSQPPTIDSAGVVSWSISHRSFTSNSVSTRTGTTQLGSCTQSYFNVDEAISLVPFIGFFVAFAFGYIAGQQR